VRAIAEGFIVRLAAAAKWESFAAGEIVFVSLAVIELNLALDPEGAVIFDSNPDGHRLFPFLRKLDRVDILGDARLGDHIGVSLAVVGLGFLLGPGVNADGMWKGSKDRKMMMAFAAQNLVSLNSSHEYSSERWSVFF
jgi:hypothetical protein